MDPIINKSGRASIAVALIMFCCATIVWLLLKGSETNGLHETALSWSYTLLCVALAALGLNVTVDSITQLLAKK